MIGVTKFDGSAYLINPHQIESIESNPDTTLVLLSGKRVVVKEKADVVVDRIVDYRRRIGCWSNED